MSADVLRRAAALMRERAEAASHHSPSPWTVHEGTFGDPANGPTDVRVSDARRLPVVIANQCREDWENGEHIASWHPAVALAVADWLETHLAESLHCSPSCPAIAVARAYLGSDS
jgi:hypothetical protein